VGGGGRPSIGDGDGDAVINVDASNSANTGSHSENESSDTDSHKPRVQLSDYQKKRFRRQLAQAGRFTQVPLRNDLTDTEAAYFAAQSFRFPGVSLKARWVRQYPQGQVAAHVVGYVGRISEDDVKKLDAENALGNYRGTDIIGKKGIEKSWQEVLHGTTGIESVEVTARGQPMRSLHRIDPVPGENLVLSIDMDLQRLAEEAFAGRRGALVAIDPRNGEVLAFVSQPSFDPQSVCRRH